MYIFYMVLDMGKREVNCGYLFKKNIKVEIFYIYMVGLIGCKLVIVNYIEVYKVVNIY